MPTPLGWKPNTRQKVHQARGELAAARADLSQLLREHNDALRAALRDDPLLSGEGNRQKRSERTATLRRLADERVAGHRERVADAEAVLQDVLATQPAPDAAGIARREAHWRRAQTLLDAGRSVGDVIAAATDPEALMALREELPTYLQARQAKPRGLEAIGWEGTDTTRVALDVDRRLVEVTDGDARAFAAARVGLAGEVPVTRLALDMTAEDIHAGRSPMATAIAVQQAGAQAGIEDPA
ncbi:hypothetical protein ABKW28_22570 [Nocardioides sp. 31GB23]|uniref:hypothetical protein n=1 Tax=Nocardioides sp. 31GB23 TaxID=3156065 RepID=UPI0032AF9CC7